MKSPEFSNIVNAEPVIEVRLLTTEDAGVYVDSIQSEADRLANLKHKMPLGNVYKSKQDMIDRLQAGEQRMGIYVDGVLAGGADTLDTGIQNEQYLSYWLRKDYTRKGIGIKAVGQVVKIKNDEGIRLRAVVEPGNFSSATILEKNGFSEQRPNSEGQYTYVRSPRDSSKVDAALKQPLPAA